MLLFGFQGEAIIAQPLIILMLAIPILIQVYFNAGFAYLLNRFMGADRLGIEDVRAYQLHLIAQKRSWLRREVSQQRTFLPLRRNRFVQCMAGFVGIRSSCPVLLRAASSPPLQFPAAALQVSVFAARLKKFTTKRLQGKVARIRCVCGVADWSRRPARLATVVPIPGARPTHTPRTSNNNAAQSGTIMSGYSIINLICSLSISHADCQLNTALDVVRGPRVDNPVMCGLNAQTMIARTDLVHGDGSQYVKILCVPTKSADEWTAEIETRKRGGSPRPRPSLIDGQIRFVYFAGADIPEASWPNINNKSHAITAYVDQPGEGVLVAAGGAQGGYSLFVKDGKPVYEYNWLGQNRYRVVSSQLLPAHKSEIRVEFKYDGGGAAKGNVTMFLNGKPVAKGRVEMTSFPRGSSEKTFGVGLDSGSPVSDQYVAPFKFTGMIDRIEIAAETKE